MSQIAKITIAQTTQSPDSRTHLTLRALPLLHTKAFHLPPQTSHNDAHDNRNKMPPATKCGYYMKPHTPTSLFFRSYFVPPAPPVLPVVVLLLVRRRRAGTGIGSRGRWVISCFHFRFSVESRGLGGARRHAIDMHFIFF